MKLQPHGTTTMSSKFNVSAAVLPALAGMSCVQGFGLIATVEFYSAGGCTGTAGGEGIFVANVCEPLRTVVSIVMSFALLRQEGCTGL